MAAVDDLVDFLAQVFVTLGKGLRDKSAQGRIPLARGNLRKIRPVSYTHLDVYKRQEELLVGGGIGRSGGDRPEEEGRCRDQND